MTRMLDGLSDAFLDSDLQFIAGETALGDCSAFGPDLLDAEYKALEARLTEAGIVPEVTKLAHDAVAAVLDPEGLLVSMGSGNGQA